MLVYDPTVTAVLAKFMVTLPVNAPPPDNPVLAIIFTVLATAPATLATGIVVDAVTGLVLLAYI